MNLFRWPCAGSICAALVACGGSAGDDGAAPAAAPVAAAAAPRHATPGPAAVAPAPATHAATMPLRDWLDQLAARHRVHAAADPAIARLPVPAALPAGMKADELLAALRDFDVHLAYAHRADGTAALVSLAVQARGTLNARTLQTTIAGRAATALPAPTDEPAPTLQQIRQAFASPDAETRRAALVRSFDFEEPLPAPTLVAALQQDTLADVRLYALMALARHPAVDRSQLRALAQAARYDPDAAVRAHANDIEAGFQAAERAE